MCCTCIQRHVLRQVWYGGEGARPPPVAPLLKICVLFIIFNWEITCTRFEIIKQPQCTSQTSFHPSDCYICVAFVKFISKSYLLLFIISPPFWSKSLKLKFKRPNMQVTIIQYLMNTLYVKVRCPWYNVRLLLRQHSGPADCPQDKSGLKVGYK